MTDITITKQSGPDTIRAVNACGVVSCVCTRSIPDCTTITIDTYNSIEISLESPSGDFPIPETEDFGNIVVKAEGNRLAFNISWTMRCLPDICGTPQSITSHSGVDINPVNTVQKQLNYWLNYFQPYSIENRYLLKVDGIARLGFIRSLKFSKSANTPITYDATLDFIAGDVVAGE